MKDDDFMTRLQESPRQAFADQLYRRITDPMATPTQPQRQLAARRLALALTLLALFLVASLALSPAARALAGDVLRQIGVLTLSDRPAGEAVLIEPASPEQLAAARATATPVVPGSREGADLAVAAREAGFEPFLPAYLPAGYSQVEAIAAQYLDDDGVALGMGILVTYLSGSGGYLSTGTTAYDGRAQDVAVGGLAVSDVMVNGQPGVWIEGIPFASSLSESETINMLLWEEGDFLVTLQADRLSLEEVLKVAASLAR
jgi:hypothetical protein